MNIRRRLLYAILALTTMTAIAVTGYQVLGGPSVTFLQSLYMAVVTLAGVGYGEIAHANILCHAFCLAPGVQRGDQLVIRVC